MEVRQTAKRSFSPASSMHETVTGQFEAITPPAKDCDVLVAGMSLQFALRSIAEQMSIPYVYAAWCPITLPSPHHAPPPMPWGKSDWATEAQRWNENFGPAINSCRASIGLTRVGDVRSHILTDQPWLAADPTLGPWPETPGLDVFQTGAWIMPDERPLSRELETFLDAGEPPVYFGFGSTRAPQDLGASMIGCSSERSSGDRLAGLG
jgi:vancomycin aglycone glucosyltransferase